MKKKPTVIYKKHNKRPSRIRIIEAVLESMLKKKFPAVVRLVNDSNPKWK